MPPGRSDAPPPRRHVATERHAPCAPMSKAAGRRRHLSHPQSAPNTFRPSTPSCGPTLSRRTRARTHSWTHNGEHIAVSCPASSALSRQGLSSMKHGHTMTTPQRRSGLPCALEYQTEVGEDFWPYKKHGSGPGTPYLKRRTRPSALRHSCLRNKHQRCRAQAAQRAACCMRQHHGGPLQTF